jgi:signal transduction histidine kinase
MKGEIAAEVSHELKNLVSVVLLNLQVIQEKMDASMAERISLLVDKTIAGAKKIQNFSLNLLTRSGQGSNLLLHDVNTLVGNFVQFMRELPKFRDNTFTFNAGTDLPKINVDIDQIQQVFLNLINNAAEAQPGVTIEITTRSEITEGRVSIVLKDTGPGIPAEVLSRLFIDKVTTKVNGHGYGLSICKQIIENHGGKITVESEQGNGATFTISLPSITP